MVEKEWLGAFDYGGPLLEQEKGGKTMKCPLREVGVHDEEGKFYYESADCLKEECAWWVKASGSCAMEAIPRIIGYVGAELKTIKEKMPHEVRR